MARVSDSLSVNGRVLLGAGALTERDTARVQFDNLMVTQLSPFTPPPLPDAPARAATCAVSTDPSYGYSLENPIKVGSGLLRGPARERAYLNALAGPNGETITYTRRGSMPFGGVILDIYDLRGLPNPVTLYVDMYTFVSPQAPAGFTCAYPIPLSAP